MKPERVQPGSPDYPPALLRGGVNRTPPIIHALGNTTLLRQPLTAVFCSTKCPGHVILDAFDRLAQLRDAGRAIVSGFHTPVEKECLRILLRGVSPIVICPGRSLDRFPVPSDWKPALTSGRLLLASPFSPGTARTTADLAQRRNEFVAALAAEILILHVTPGGRLESVVRQLEQSGHTVMRLESLAPPRSTVPTPQRSEIV